MNYARKGILFCFFLFCLLSLKAQQTKDYSIITIGFYNLENLFDIHDDPNTFDEDFTPTGKDKWTEKDYEEKIKRMAFAISEIGRKEAGGPPVVIGLCEMENRDVLEDLIKDPCLSHYNYGIIHFDSPDQRGIDVALLYRQDFFEATDAVAHELLLYDQKDQRRIFTRDQLVVSGNLDGEKMHFIVNHWPSRSGGEKASSSRRKSAALLNRKIIDSIHKFDPYAKIISMGDFNDDPYNESLSKTLGARTEKNVVQLKEMYNPMAAFSKKGIGSLGYRDSWNLFDQILVSKGLLSRDGGYNFYKASVFNANFLTTPTGQYKGYPFRSFGGGGYSGGYSDHFPVFIYLIKEIDPGEN